MSISWKKIDILAIIMVTVFHMMDYGFNFMNTKIHIDNESTISVIKNPVAHSRTKHIEIHFHFIRDCYEKRLIEVIKIHTYSNVADLLTKGFDVTRFNFLVDKYGFEKWIRRCFDANSSHNGLFTSLRSKLQLADATGIHNLSDANIYAGLATLGPKSGGWESQFRSYAGDFVPLLPVMLAGAAMDQGDRSAQPAEPHHTHVDPLPSTSLPPISSPPLQSPPHSPLQSPPLSPL
ncbi:hypothetical protein Tco_0409045 [Tanacetum coccineum]